jgi:hypothetical protein
MPGCHCSYRRCPVAAIAPKLGASDVDPTLPNGDGTGLGGVGFNPRPRVRGDASFASFSLFYFTIIASTSVPVTLFSDFSWAIGL